MTPTISDRVAAALAALGGKVSDTSELESQLTAAQGTINKQAGQLAIVGDIDKLTAATVSLETLAGIAGA